MSDESFDLRTICRDLAKAKTIKLSRCCPMLLNSDVFGTDLYFKESRYVGKDKFALHGQRGNTSLAYFGYMKPKSWDQYKTYRSLEHLFIEDPRLTIDVTREGNCSIRVRDKRVISSGEEVAKAMPTGRGAPFVIDFNSQVLETSFERDNPEGYELLEVLLEKLMTETFFL